MIFIDLNLIFLEIFAIEIVRNTISKIHSVILTLTNFKLYLAKFKPKSMKKQLLGFLAVFLVNFLSFSQNATLKGTVSDTLGNPLFNTRVLIDGTGKGAVTNDRGQYSIFDIVPGTYTVMFRNLEFKTLERKITLNPGDVVELNVRLSNEKEFDEVLIIGYGTTRTTDLTGSASVIKEDNFLKGNVGTPEQLIMGKAAGVKINTNDGAPGSGSTIRLRGGTSINASNDPLIVVDGVPLDNGGIAGSANALSLINPDDIASFVILKDASATAIYGSRGANGVILITTKKGSGKEDKVKVTLQSNTSLMTVARYADVMDGDEFRRLVNENGTPEMAALLGKENTDWQREVFRSALTADNNFSVTGGIKKLPYRFSYGNRYENGLLKRDLFVRNSVSLNFTPKFLDDHLMIEFNNRFAQTSNNFANRGALGAAYFDPTQPVFSGNNAYGGYFEWLTSQGTPVAIAPRNPVGLLYQREDQSQVVRYIGNFKATYKLPFFPDIKATVNLGIDRARGQGFTSTPNTSASGTLGIGALGSWNEYEQRRGNKLLETYVNYNNSSKGSKHLIDATLIYTAQDWFTFSPNLPVFSFNQDTIIVPANPNPFDTRNAMISYVGRLIYSYDNRYVANVSLRRDGSSRFSPETRWGMFPSASAAWIISNEEFLKNVSLVNMLKLRAGWGVTGQQDGIGDYAYIGNYYPGALTAQYAFGGQWYPVLRPDGFDANLKWETTSSINLGLDFGLKNDRINGTIDVYRKDTRDLLAVVPVAAGSNFTNQILTNVGSMRNEGIEITTTFGLIAKKDMRLNLGANATYNRNTVMKLAQISDPDSPGILVGGISGGVGNTIQVHQIGFPTFSFLVYEQQYDATGKPIEVGAINPNTGVAYTDIEAFADRNGDGIINIDDRYIFPQAAPLWFLGLSLDFTYKKWYAGVSMRSELGGHLYNNIHSNNGTFQSVNGTQEFLNNISTLYYNEEFQRTTERQLLSDHYIEKVDFLRLDYVNFGYDFGRIKKWKEYVGVRAGVTVSNLLVVTKYSGLDPEINGGIDNNIYPRPRVFTLNLTFNF